MEPRSDGGDDRATTVPAETDVEWAAWVRRMKPVAAVEAGRPGLTPGTWLAGRFRIEEWLGKGGMGEVYRAYDSFGSRPVALKTLPSAAGSRLLRFKREFRQLSEFTSPHCVQLHELHEDQNRWFLTMELLDGCDLANLVRAPWRTVQRPLFAQLARGIRDLHRAGLLHNDLKPSNVRVCESGRVMILDFGLVGQLSGEDEAGTSSHRAGTPHYMAPESRTRAPRTEASDWYSFGVMITEALGKSGADDPGATRLAQGLCAEDPSERSGYSDVAAFFELDADDELPAPPHEVPFVGRTAELERLRRALDETTQNRAVTVAIEGSSGIGKSALVATFCRGIDRGATVLAARCSEHERSSYNAIDPLVDGLVAALDSLHPDALTQWNQPSAFTALVEMFPALAAATAWRPLANVRPAEADPARRRRVAFEALRRLLVALSRKQPLVIVIDDAQWVDVDSVQELRRLATGEDAVPALWVLTHRSLADPSAQPPWPWTPTHTLALEPLDAQSCAELAAHLLGPEHAQSERVIAESAGHPYLLAALCVSAAASTEVDKHSVGRLDALLTSALSSMPPAARQLMEVVSASPRPLRRRILEQAAGSGSTRVDLLHRLRAARLLRSHGPSAEDLVAPYHDRVREALYAALTADTRRHIHARLAHLLAHDVSDPREEDVLYHYERTGETTHLAEWALRAARRSDAELAFSRAAELYQRALQAHAGPHEEREAIALARARALAHAGRCAEAANAFSDLAASAAPSRGLDYRRQAVELRLISGQVEQGLAELAPVMRSVGLTLARTPLEAIARLIWQDVRLRVRGLELRSSTAGPDASKLFRVDVLMSLTFGLMLIDHVQGDALSAAAARAALDSGDSVRAARALAARAIFTASPGRHNRQRSLELLERSAQLSQATPDAAVQALTALAHGTLHYTSGQWSEAGQQLTLALETIHSRCRGMPGEANLAAAFRLWSRFVSGQVGALRREVAEGAEQAFALNNAIAAAVFGTMGAVGALSEDAPARARATLDRAHAMWRSERFRLPDGWFMLAEGLVSLYGDQPEVGLDYHETRWKAVEQSQMLRVGMIAMLHCKARADLALASAHAGRLPEAQAHAIADAMVQRLSRVDIPAGKAQALSTRAAQCLLRGQTDAARVLLEQAAPIYAAEGMRMHEASVRLCLGQLYGPEPASHARRAHALLSAEGVHCPERFARAYCWLPAVER